MEAERHDGAGSGGPSGSHTRGIETLGFLDPALWRQLSEAADKPAAFCQAWLTLQCAVIKGVSRALLLVADRSEGGLQAAARYPESDASDQDALQSIAESALARGRGVVNDTGAANLVAFPLSHDGSLAGAVALEISARSQADLRLVMRQLQWGSAWLQIARGASARAAPAAGDGGAEIPAPAGLVTVLEQVANSLEHSGFRAAARAVATETATTLGCERVAIGLVEGRRSRLAAISHSADFGKRSNLARALESAMDEAIDQRDSLTYPEDGSAVAQTTRAHALLAEENQGLAICTVPFIVDGRMRGAWTFERTREQPFDPESVRLCRQLAGVIGPILDLKHREERWLGLKALDSARTQAERLIGPGFMGRKLFMAAAAAAVVFFSFYTAPFRVNADAALEGSVQRVIAAPMDGYIGDVQASAGDLVQQGDLLLALEDADLRLEEVKWTTRRAQLERSRQDALARGERAESRIYKAQVDQADAELELLGEQLARTTIRSPFDGIVVSGDLTQSLGAPVERGEVLMEVAPLDSYRVALSVDERDIAYVEVGQTGELILASLPDGRHEFSVTKITPIASAAEGRNTFRIEADLLEPSDTLRPGMQGAGKIDAGEARLIWIWTRRFTEWMQVWAWRWMS